MLPSSTKTKSVDDTWAQGSANQWQYGSQTRVSDRVVEKGIGECQKVGSEFDSSVQTLDKPHCDAEGI